MKKESPKDASHLKKNKNYLHKNRYKKGIEKKGKLKKKSIRNFKNVTTTIKFFTFTFCIRKRIYFTLKHSFGKCDLHYYFSSEAFFGVAGYLKRINEIQRPCRSALVL